MSVTNYTPESSLCKYRYDRLRNVIYLVSKSHVKNIHIDNGAAYIDDLSEYPTLLRGFGIQFSEESSLDERYAFSKTLTMSMRGYATPDAFNDKYYIIIQSEDGTFWMINPDFPVKVTYSFNLSSTQNQTDFTFSINSNFPTLELVTDMDISTEYQCLPLTVPGIESLKLLEAGYAGIDTENKIVYTYGKSFKDIEYLKYTCSLNESFDGEKITTTISFNIGFDAYKSSWHYNLLEFTENLYAAIVIPKDGDNTYFAGFNFGLQPNFVVKTEEGTSDIITINLVEMSNHGATAANDYHEEEDTDTTWIYVDRVGDTLTYECVSAGVARYLVQQEINAKGYATGKYKALYGYENSFPNLNIIGTFSTTTTFSNPNCYDQDRCDIDTSIPNIITFTDVSCKIYSLSSTCPWTVTDIPSYLTVSPSSGNANTSYSIQVCNISAITSDIYGGFYINSGNSSRLINVRLSTSGEPGILSPDSHTITCLSQDVRFTFDPSCQIRVTSIDPSLSYNVGYSQLEVTVPRNQTTSAKTWSITVKDCNNDTQTVYIYQDKTYESWVTVSGYMCANGNSYTKQSRYTGATSSSINVATGEYRPGELIQSGDTRCSSSQTRWVFNGNYYCINGNKVQCVEEEISYDGGTTWAKTGATTLGETVADSDHFCDQSVTYSWRQSQRWICNE